MRKVGGKLPELEQGVKPSECALPSREVCAFEPDIKYMREFLYTFEPKSQGWSKTKVVDALKEHLNVKTEAGIWESKPFRDFIGRDTADEILKTRYKPPGPGKSTALLDNFNIDDTLEQWSVHGNNLYKKKFHHIPFQMIDFAIVGTELATLDVKRLIDEKYDCFGVVLNTDISTGPGKHWFCLYGDLKHKGTREDPITLEYFNSSGNPPMTQVDVWLEKTKHDLLRDHNIHAEIVRSVPQRLQQSQTECGVWSLLYIKSRLEGHPPNWFYKVKATDKDMIAYRQYLFRSKLTK